MGKLAFMCSCRTSTQRSGQEGPAGCQPPWAAMETACFLYFHWVAGKNAFKIPVSPSVAAQDTSLCQTPPHPASPPSFPSYPLCCPAVIWAPGAAGQLLGRPWGLRLSGEKGAVRGFQLRLRQRCSHWRNGAFGRAVSLRESRTGLPQVWDL